MEAKRFAAGQRDAGQGDTSSDAALPSQLSIGTTLALAAVSGAVAGIASALADYGAHWLFMESMRDRAWLLLRLLSLEPTAGACLGALLGGFISSSGLALRRLGVPPQRLARARAALFGLLLAPPLSLLAGLLFSGGKMSRVAGRAGWTITSASGLVIVAGLAWLIGAHWFRSARASSWLHARRSLLAWIALGFAAGKLDQWVLPNFYDYLHALLSLFALGAYGLAPALFFVRAIDRGSLRSDPSLRRASRRVSPPTAAKPRRRRRAVALIAGMAALLALTARLSLTSLDQNQNVRVALASADMPHARSLMLALAPLLPPVDSASASLARQHAAAARSRRAQLQGRADLPTVPDAHVLLISIDALRADHVGALGYARGVTPQLDALAARGVVFEHAYAQAPHSSYSLCSLMTSEYLHETTELGLPPPHDTLPRVLGAAGYHTAAFYTEGIFHTAGERLGSYEADAFGFALHDHQDRPAEEMTDRALSEIDRTLARGEPSSLFWVHYFDVHEPYEATTLGTSDMDRYDSELLATDRAIGRLVREAQARLHRPLVVVITADHGEEFHEHGGVYHGSSLYEEQVHVPLFFVAPGLTATRVAQPVESVDIAPTLLGLLEVERPRSMRGADLRGLLMPGAAPRGPVFSAVIHKRMVVRWPYKLIADLRFGSFELYDLERDPNERDNRADREPQRVRDLRGELYAFLDSLAPSNHVPDQESVALEWGRLGDRRAVEPLMTLLGNHDTSSAARTEAARLLGRLADPSSTDSLLAATRSPDRWVGAEAAIALGRLFDPRAARMLRQLVSSEDPDLRSRAAVSLGRLRDRAAVPSLIDALWLAPSPYEREEAVRWLGRLRDVRALEPLLNLLPETRTRHLVVVAMGEIGDGRAFVPLTHVLFWDRNTNVRDGAVRGLGMLGDERALAVLWPLVSEDPALRNTGESLVRLRALERRLIGGSDVQAGMPGFGHCFSGPLRHDWDYLHRTFCTSERDRVSLRLNVPASVAQARAGNVVLISMRRADASTGTELDLQIGQQAPERLHIDGAWSEQRVSLPYGSLQAGQVRAELRMSETGTRVDLDHVLIVPRSDGKSPEAHGG